MADYGRKRASRLFVVRHGERIDRIFENWMDDCWEQNQYKPTDLNMPMLLPKKRYYGHYTEDSPLTEVGYFEAQSVGRSLRAMNCRVDHIYCSPAFRCVQTATGILKTSEHTENKKIKIEPGLFEYMGWYPKKPEWFTAAELDGFNFHVDTSYVPMLSVDDLHDNYLNETKDDYYKRCQEVRAMNAVTTLYPKRENACKKVIEHIVDEHKTPCNIVVVAHGPNLDASIRPLLKRKMNVPKDRFNDFGALFPFCSFVALQKIKNSWESATEDFPPFSYTDFKNCCDEDFVNRR